MRLWNAHVSFTILAAAPLVLGACSVRKGPDTTLSGDRQGQGTANDGVGSGTVEDGEFKLYDKPFHEANPSCDLFTKLTLLTTDKGPTAVMEQKLEGTCELPVPPPNLRTYVLKEGESSCGSHFYTGSRQVEGKTATVVVNDHRKRTCRDLTEGKIVVEETDGAGQKRRLFSSAAAAPEDVSYTGVLTRIAGIGGESTGFGLSLDDGSLVEIDLRTAGLHTEFKEDARVSVSGFLKQVSGVESTRQVLQVAKMTAATP